eukprot:6203259-Pleurochrysis_carterae.AAC.1
MEGHVGYTPRPDQMHPNGSYILCGAGCHGLGRSDSPYMGDPTVNWSDRRRGLALSSTTTRADACTKP